MEPVYLKSQSEWHEWLLENHDKATEFQMGFHKTKSRTKGITYKEAVDEALCFGWIDGHVKGIDALTYTQRFTPRTPKSIWSNKNTKRVEELIEAGLMQPSGLKAFELRNEKRAGVYSFESEAKEFTGELLEIFVSNTKAWEYFLTTPPSYKRPATHLVLSAKQESTRIKRLQELINASENGERIDALKRRTWKRKED